MNIDDIILEVKRQFENEENCTDYGEPQAWIYLDNGRSIEIVHEEEGLDDDEQFFGVYLHCADEEYNNRYFYKTVGVIEDVCSFDTPNVLDVDLLKSPLEHILKVNAAVRKEDTDEQLHND